jgi:YlmC/YmxH family sporulation protein
MTMMRISEFQIKDVVNVSDGKKLGNISDIDIDMNTGKIQAVIISKQTCHPVEANCQNWRRCHIGKG